MNLQKIIKRIQRETKANPAKAGVLALLLAVAVYFWAPLAGQLFRSEANRAGPAASVAQTTGDGPVETVPEWKSKPWQEIVRAINDDPRMHSAPATSLMKNPFAEPKTVPEPVAEPTQIAEAPVKPEELGLVLTSTVVGPAFRAALINGRVYREGTEIVDEHRWAYVLAKVEAHQVVLTRDGKSFELTLSRTTAAVP